jgi:hypothetical protein
MDSDIIELTVLIRDYARACGTVETLRTRDEGLKADLYSDMVVLPLRTKIAHHLTVLALKGNRQADTISIASILTEVKAIESL